MKSASPNRFQLRCKRRAWGASFTSTLAGHDREEHSPTSATGTAWERTPWHATQRAALEALARMSVSD